MIFLVPDTEDTVQTPEPAEWRPGDLPTQLWQLEAVRRPLTWSGLNEAG